MATPNLLKLLRLHGPPLYAAEDQRDGFRPDELRHVLFENRDDRPAHAGHSRGAQIRPAQVTQCRSSTQPCSSALYRPVRGRHGQDASLRSHGMAIGYRQASPVREGRQEQLQPLAR